MTPEQAAAELSDLRTILTKRGANVSYVCLRFWHGTLKPHWEAIISLTGEPDLMSGNKATSSEALDALAHLVGDYRPAREKLAEILGVAV